MLLGRNKNHSVEKRYLGFVRACYDIGFLAIHTDGGECHLRARRTQSVEHVVERFGFAGIFFQPDNGNASVG